VTTGDRLPNAAKARAFSQKKIDAMRDYLANEVRLGDEILIGTNGSYARREASGQSDLDFFVICRTANKVDEARAVLAKIAPNLIEIAGRKPSKDGAFGHVEDLSAILTNIGGNDDLNQKITRRVLLLLEGEWLNNEKFLRECQHALLDRYIRPKITSHQLALFLLNDIIRYYRTVCVDWPAPGSEDTKLGVLMELEVRHGEAEVHARV
jgi:predicted nucleotidyltransferase